MEEVKEKGIKRFINISGIVIAGMLIGILAGCGSQKPTNTVEEFMTSFKTGEFEKAGTYVKGGLDDLEGSNENE